MPEYIAELLVVIDADSYTDANVLAERAMREAMQATTSRSAGRAKVVNVILADVRSDEEDDGAAGSPGGRTVNHESLFDARHLRALDALRIHAEQVSQFREREERELATALLELLKENAQLRRVVKRAEFIALHLHATVDRETWRATGGDDQQGHYEGDYHAEQVAAEIRSWTR